MRLRILTIMMFSFHIATAQTIEPLEDKAAVGQEKRQVYREWGSWHPENKKWYKNPRGWLLHHMVWKWNSTNKNYKKGEDIRPLKEDGEETQRTLLQYQLKEETDKVLEETKILEKEHLLELNHVINETAKTDPMYLLYYRKRLKPLREIGEFSDFKEHYKIPSLNDEQKEEFYEQFEILKDKLDMSYHIDMPRGKRFLNYHEIFRDLRDLEDNMTRLNRSNENLLRIRTKSKHRFNKSKPFNNSNNQEEINDLKRFEEMIIDNNLNNF